MLSAAALPGVSAAVAASRQGKKVLLLEKASYLGGLATLGLVVLYHPPLDDNTGRRLIGGLAEELLHLSIKYSYGRFAQGVDIPAETARPRAATARCSTPQPLRWRSTS